MYEITQLYGVAKYSMLHVPSCLYDGRVAMSHRSQSLEKARENVVQVGHFIFSAAFCGRVS